MNESEIMKALECRNEDIICAVTDKDNNTYFVYNRDVIDLINRKNAESERVTTERDHLTETYMQVCNAWHDTTIELQAMRNRVKKMRVDIKTARAEAIKEFAERVKAKHRRITDYDEAGFGCQIFIVEEEYIDQIAKEMGVEL